MDAAPSHPELLGLVAQIVSAHAAHNTVTVDALPDVIRSVYAALSGAGAGAATADASPAVRPQPAVPVKKSVFADYIVCLEDGKKLKVLKRHLATVYGLTPDEYRQRWGLPDGYPMVAPNYAEKRSALAKSIGLGRKAASSKELPAPPVLRVPEGMTSRRAARRAKTT